MKKRIIPMLLCMLLVFGLTVSPLKAAAAIKPITVDKKEYNLHIEDIPSFTSEWNAIFAKLNNVKDSSSYALSLFDDLDSSDVLVEGLNKANVSVDPDNVYGMDIMIYKMDSDGEYYPAQNATDCTIICPVPDFWIDDAEKLSLYNVSSAGKSQKMSFSLVQVDTVPCMKFTIKNTGVFGFVLNDSEVESEEKENNISKPTPIPTKAPTPTNTPVKPPTYGAEAKPTTAPTIQPTKTPDSNSSGNNNATTNKPLKDDQSTSSTNEEVMHELDATPQTGDDAATELWMLSAGLSASAIVGILMFLRHKR